MSIVLFIIIITIVIVWIFVLYRGKGTTEEGVKDLDKKLTNEVIVCREITEIYCHNISCIDTLCGINKSITKSLEKFLSSVSLSGGYETHQLKSLEDEIDLRLCEIKSFEENIPNLKLSIDSKDKDILFKHDLTVQEIDCAENCVKQSISEIQDNFIYLKLQLEDFKKNRIGIHFALTKLKTFQFESNAIFYGFLEGICTFPIESLKLYYELAPHWKNIPKGVTIQSLDKSGFKMYQEMEFDKVTRYMDITEDFIDNCKTDVDNLINDFMCRDVNFFIAGSTSLQLERDVFAGVINLLQSQWRPLGINVNSYSYQNFPKDINIGGHQEQYNHFIMTHVNVSVFILSGKAGAHTMEEFEVALNSLKKSGRPKIYVYSLNDGQNRADSLIHTKMEQEKQYWIEYKNIDELRLMLERDLNKYLLDEYSKLNAGLI